MEDTKEDMMKKKNKKNPHPFKGIGGFLEDKWMILIGQSNPHCAITWVV